jgi:hypothetical protein
MTHRVDRSAPRARAERGVDSIAIETTTGS